MNKLLLLAAVFVAVATLQAAHAAPVSSEVNKVGIDLFQIITAVTLVTLCPFSLVH